MGDTKIIKNTKKGRWFMKTFIHRWNQYCMLVDTYNTSRHEYTHKNVKRVKFLSLEQTGGRHNRKKRKLTTTRWGIICLFVNDSASPIRGFPGRSAFFRFVDRFQGRGWGLRWSNGCNEFRVYPWDVTNVIQFVLSGFRMTICNTPGFNYNHAEK